MKKKPFAKDIRPVWRTTNLLFSGINAEIRDISIFNDTVKAVYCYPEKSKADFEIKKLQANMKLTPGDDGIFKPQPGD